MSHFYPSHSPTWPPTPVVTSSWKTSREGAGNNWVSSENAWQLLVLRSRKGKSVTFTFSPPFSLPHLAADTCGYVELEDQSRRCGEQLGLLGECMAALGIEISKRKISNFHLFPTFLTPPLGRRHLWLRRAGRPVEKVRGTIWSPRNIHSTPWY
jgi:hypothetical protein